MGIELASSITDNYPHWLCYAQSIIRGMQSTLEPTEVVNDTICRLADRDSRKLESLREQINGLDRYVKRAIKIAIISPRSRLRYRKGGHCTSDAEWIENIGIADDENDDCLDIPAAYELVPTILDEMNITPEEREIFTWRFFGREFAEYPGDHSRSKLSKSYLKVRNKIIPILLGKIGA